MNRTLSTIAIPFCFSVMASLASAQGPVRSQSTEAVAASPDAVCKFISGRMQSSLPQIPTLCSGKQKAPGDYEINVFSPQNVLEGNMRKGWSSALFQTLESLVSDQSLNGACSGKKVACFVSVKDSLMATENVHFRLLLDGTDTLPLPQTIMDSSHITEFSDSWYIMWWDSMMQSKESEHPQSKENAELIAKDACDVFLRSIAKQFEMLNKPPPSCSVLLATDRSIYVELDFNELVQALVANNWAGLPTTFGKAFDASSYDGQVIVKSPWMGMSDGTQQRVYYLFPLWALEFLYEEIHSGSRSEAESLITLVDFRSEGQTTLTSLFDSKQKGNDLTLRNAAVVHVNFGHDSSVLLQTTDGAEWRTTEQNFIRCGVYPGKEVEVLATPDMGPSISVDNEGTNCRLDVTFVRGW